MRLYSTSGLVVLIVFTVCASAAPISVSSADPLDNWHWRNPLPQGNNLAGVAHGNGMFVAVGGNGAILTSSDGAGWTLRNTGVIDSLQGVAYGNGTFVAVGDFGTVVTSPDGASWTLRDSGVFDLLEGIAYGNGTFVAVASDGAVLASTDGVNWTLTAPGTDSYGLNSVAYGNGTFVAVGYNGVILSSPDGASWTLRNSGVSDSLQGVAYGNGTFVTVGNVSTILTSADGITWTRQVTATPSSFNGIAFGNGMFVAVGFFNKIFTSSDGVTWTTRDSGFPVLPSLPLNAVAYGNGTFAVVGHSGRILSSQDGINWVHRHSTAVSSSIGLGSVAYGGGTFVVAGASGDILTSSSGKDWTLTSGSINGLVTAVAYGNGLFVAVGGRGTGGGGAILSSPDGINWTPRVSSADALLLGIAYGNGIFVAVGDGGTILTSSDGTAWTAVTSGTLIPLRCIAYGDGKFVAGGGGDIAGTLLTSSDGQNWTMSETPWRFTAISYGNDTFVAVAVRFILGPVSTSVILISRDGVEWFERFSDAGILGGISYGSGTFVIMGMPSTAFPGYPQLLTSPDGVHWVSRALRPSVDSTFFLTPTAYGPGIGYGNGTFILVGGNGAILQSDPMPSTCTALLSSALTVHIPVIAFGSMALSAHLQYTQDSAGDILFRAINARVLTNTDQYRDCQPATLSLNGHYRLHVPSIDVNGEIWWADLEHVPAGGDQVSFKVTGAGQN